MQHEGRSGVVQFDNGEFSLTVAFGVPVPIKELEHEGAISLPVIKGIFNTNLLICSIIAISKAPAFQKQGAGS